MHSDINTEARTELKFFSRVTASISHELKNVLAIINENAGLLDDFCVMAGRGDALSPEKLALVCEKIRSQVLRGTAVIQSMNQLAHSVDDDFVQTDQEAVVLTTTLSARFAALKQAKIVMDKGDQILIRASPFSTICLLSLCLEAMLVAAGKGGTVTVGTCNKDKPVVEFSVSKPTRIREFPTPEASELAKSVGALMEIVEAEGLLRLAFQEKNQGRKSL
ncbi:MAG: HAMP domain-containing histidine kinase [Desulfobulbaceae bacterium]|nr:HAMP domain-containing histidine kinase [Desulfobulbaceae bacterium]